MLGNVGSGVASQGAHSTLGPETIEQLPEMVGPFGQLQKFSVAFTVETGLRLATPMPFPPSELN